MKIITSIGFLLLSALFCNAQPPTYHFLKSFPVEGEGRWDYLSINPTTGYLYVSHATQVNIFNGQGDAIGVIPNTTGVHGVAFATDYRKGYISNGKLNSVGVFDMKNNEVTEQIKTGDNPDAIIYDPFSRKIYVSNGKSNSISVIDPGKDVVVATIPVGGKPEMIVSDEMGRIFVNLEDKSEIAVIQADRNEVIAHWPLGKGQEPTGLAIDNKGHRLFAGCDKMLVVVNAMDGKIVDNITIGAGCDGVAYDPNVREIYTSNGADATLSIIKEVTPDKYMLLKNVPTQKGAKTLALDPAQQRIYMTTADFKPVKPATNGGKPGRPEIVEGTVRVLIYTR